VTVAGLRKNRRRLRSRLAIGLTISTLLVAATIAIAATALAGWQSGTTDDATRAGAARVGEDVTVVIVADEGASEAAAQARSETLRWSLVALAASLLPAIGVAWFAAGRMLGAVDDALTGIEAADEERERRLQEVVHELRTPLAVMGTNLELAAGNGNSEDFIEAARRAAIRMGRTVDDLAGHGRLAVKTDDRHVELAKLAGEVIAEFAGPAQSRGLHLGAVGSTAVVAAEVDPAAVRTAVGNFVGNAVRLAPGGSTISLDWGTTAGWGWIAVGDEGPGLPEELHARVFEREWQGRHDRDRATSGRGGLGLTIARQLTEAQGGLVTIDSEEGGGSVFALWLPLGPDSDRREVVAEDGIHPAATPWKPDHVAA
jgi:signal transduction histidine kinase